MTQINLRSLYPSAILPQETMCIYVHYIVNVLFNNTKARQRSLRHSQKRCHKSEIFLDIFLVDTGDFRILVH